MKVKRSVAAAVIIILLITLSSIAVNNYKQPAPLTYNTFTVPNDIENMFIIDDGAFVEDSLIDSKTLTETDVTASIYGEKPTILIFHTHSTEDFADSRPNEVEDTIVGVGNTLAEILANDYGVSVVHDTNNYDIVNGEVVRDGSYERMESSVKKLLKKYPSVKVLIDLHRDGVPDDVRLVTEIDGKQCAKVMFVNGVCNLNVGGESKKTTIQNKYILQNIALSLKMEVASEELYSGFTRKIYIKPYRYSLHLKPLSLLIETGANTSTVEEAKNAMKPLAEVLVGVLTGSSSFDIEDIEQQTD